MCFRTSLILTYRRMVEVKELATSWMTVSLRGFYCRLLTVIETVPYVSRGKKCAAFARTILMTRICEMPHHDERHTIIPRKEAAAPVL